MNKSNTRVILDEWWCCPNCGSVHYIEITEFATDDEMEPEEETYFRCVKCYHEFARPDHHIIAEDDDE